MEGNESGRFLRAHAVLDVLIEESAALQLREALVVLLKVRLSGLRARADRHRIVLEVLARGQRLEDVRASRVDAADEHAHAVRALRHAARLQLTLYTRGDAS